MVYHAPKSIVRARDVVSKRCNATEGWLVDILFRLRVSEAIDGEALDPSFLSIRYVSCFPSQISALRTLVRALRTDETKKVYWRLANEGQESQVDSASSRDLMLCQKTCRRPNPVFERVANYHGLE